MTHWQASCLINACLLGDPTEPLCSRVYRQPESRWRAAYLRAADSAFHEQDHCMAIHVRWLLARYP